MHHCSPAISRPAVMGLTRASLGKFDKGGIGLYGYAPDSARASVVGRQWQSIKISQSYQNFGVEEERSAARSAGQVAAIVPRRLTHHGPSAGRRRPFYLFIPRLVGERDLEERGHKEGNSGKQEHYADGDDEPVDIHRKYE